MQDVESLLQNLTQLEKLQDKHDAVLKSLEKWDNYNDPTFEQIEQKKKDGENEAELSSLVDISAKIIIQACDDGWEKKVQEYRDGLSDFSKSMLNSWSKICDGKFKRKIC